MALLKIYDDIKNENDAIGFFGDSQDVFSASRLSDFLTATQDEEIDGRLHCRGGSVSEGYTCHDLLTHSGKKISMTVDGTCASIATVILLAAPKESRKILPNAQVMIHEPYIPEYTLADSYTAADLARMAMDLEQETNRLVDFYVQHTGSDREELLALVKAETYLNAQEALRLGFIGQILPPTSNSMKSFKEKFNIMDNKKVEEIEAKMSTIDLVIAKISKFLHLDAVNMDLTDATGATFTIEKEAGEPAVGDKASPDGTYTMDDGTVIVVSSGSITEITPVADTPDEMEALKTENETLKAEIETLKTANAQALEADKAALIAELTEAKAIKVELQGLKSKFFPEGRLSEEQEHNVPSTKKEIERRRAEIQAKQKK